MAQRLSMVPAVTRALDALICALAASLLFIAATGGVDVEAGPLRVRLHDWTRPLLLLVLAIAARFATSLPTVAPSGAEVGARDASIDKVATIGMLALLLAATGVYVRYHVRVAGGLDSYGYVSAAHLLASGSIREPQPLAALLPFDAPMHAATPLGHVPSGDGRTSVPRFPLGMPAVMALFTPLGASAVYFVPIVMACAAMGLAFLLGRAPASRDTHSGVLAAALLAVDPLFAAYAIQPMSDVPAVCWLLAAVWVTLRSGSSSAFPSIAGGICAGMAMLTRPALLPAIVVLVLVSAGDRPWRHVLALGGTVAAFITLQLVLNAALHGGVTLSGYGTTSHMFEVSADRFAANVSNFGRWLTYSHTPLFWMLWPGALWVLRAQTWAWRVSAVAAAPPAPYLFYMVFDDWESSRFLLPSIALVLILSARALHKVLGSSPLSTTSPLVMLTIALACGAASHTFLRRDTIYQLATLEAKYPLTGEWFATNTSERAVVLAGLHSGSIRLYGKRPTVRWDHIPDRALSPTVTALIAGGYEPYLALDLPSEPPEFEARFGTDALRFEQVARVRVVNIYKFVSAP